MSLTGWSGKCEVKGVVSRARCLLSLMVCLSLAGGALGYQKSDKKGKATKGADSAYEIGQEVEVEYFSKWRPGKVVGLPASGRIQVEFEFDPLGDASGKAGGAKAKEGEEKKMKSFFDAKQVRVAALGLLHRLAPCVV